MEQLTVVLDFIDQNEGLLSGLAATMAILGVCLAMILKLGKALRARGISDDREASSNNPSLNFQQDIRYTRTPSDINLAWSSLGEGVPLVRALGWFTNLESEWQNPKARKCVETLASKFRYIRYDARGMGMSQREVEEVSSATRLEDLETVIDAAGVDRVVLMGISEGGTTAIEYATKHPERVSHLILWGTFLKSAPDEAYREQWNALFKLLPTQWGSDNPAFHQIFTSLFLPEADAGLNQFFNEMQRESASADIVVQTLASIGMVDVTEKASRLSVPTLVVHRTEDLVVPVERGRHIAATIPGAKLVLHKGTNHWIFGDPPAFRELVEEIEDFLESTASAGSG